MESTLQTHYQQAADALWAARNDCAPIAPLRGCIDGNDLAGAYLVQRHNNMRRLAVGQRQIGRKIGLTSLAVQQQLGVDQPDFGLLFDDMLYEGNVVNVAGSALMQPKIEGELAFILASDVTERDLPREALAEAAGQVAAAFEIVDSAINDWKITLADTVADNASCGALVLGGQRRHLTEFNARLAGMVMSEAGRVISTGVGAASLGDPLNAFAWLANLAVEQGEPLRRGEIVLTGALGPMVPFIRGKRYRLEIAGFAPLEAYRE